MKSAKMKKILFFRFLPVSLLLALLLGCNTANLNWSAFKFGQTARQGETMDDKAVARFLSQIRHRPGNPAAHYNLAVYYQERGRYGQAIVEYDKVIMADPAHIRAYNGKGICHDQMGAHDEAIASFRKAAALDADREYVWNNLCYSHYLKGEYPEAVAACERALSINSGNLRIRNNLGMVLAVSGQHDRAFREFSAAGGGDGTYAHLKMAAIYHDKAMFAKAVEQYRAALDRNPQSREAGEGLRASTEQLKIADAAAARSAAAAMTAERVDGGVTEMRPSDGVIDALIDEKKAAAEFAVAMTLYEKGSFTEAARHFERSLNHNPRLKSANRGMAAARALAKIVAAPSTRIAGAGDARRTATLKKRAVLPGNAGIEISNGNGKRHMARDMGKYLRGEGFHVVRVANANHFNHTRGAIYYQKDYRALADELASRIPELTDLRETRQGSRPDVKVRIVLGRNMIGNPPTCRN